MGNDVKEHYNAVAHKWGDYYDEDKLYESGEYPSPTFRLRLLANLLGECENVKRICEVGVGEGTPLLKLMDMGYDVRGFDFSEEMVKRARDNFAKANKNPNRIFLGDITNPLSYLSMFGDWRIGKFDAVVAFGVLPHVEHDATVIKNMGVLLRPDGRIYVEFRNKLMSLFSFNRYTLEFVCDELLSEVDKGLVSAVGNDLYDKLDMHEPPVREKAGDAPGYDVILSKFHNPFEMEELFCENGFKDVKLHWYHYHAGLPKMEREDPELFRKESIKLEHRKADWKSYFLCSTFIVEATKE